jgi:hypothetical protein
MSSFKWITSARKAGRKFGKWLRGKGKNPSNGVAGISREDCAQLAAMRGRHVVPVREPMLLISQAPRSGGTFLSQLFDGHPHCHAHPGELDICHPDKTTWPRLDLNATADEWWSMLDQPDSRLFFQKGYKKSGLGASEARLPFLLVPSLQRALFAEQLAATPIHCARDVLNCYWTAYFNAWLDNQNLLGTQKEWLTAFTPRLMQREQSVADFFSDYPDGILVSVIRDPLNWYASARRWSPGEYGPIDLALGHWEANAQAMLRNHERFPSQVILLTFEKLLQDTAATVRWLAERLGIQEHPALLTPTFNNQPIKANSSYHVPSAGVLREPMDRFRQDLEGHEIAQIERQALPIFEEVVGRAA